MADFADKTKIDLDVALAKLKAAGIVVESSAQPLAEIAEANGISPQHIYDVIKPESSGGSNAMPEEAPGGTGNRTLEKICQRYRLDQDKIVQGLAEKGIIADPKQTMKTIAIANSVDPHAVYAAIYELAKK